MVGYFTPNCALYSDNYPSSAFKLFPTDKILRRKWINIIGCNNYFNNNYSFFDVYSILSFRRPEHLMPMLKKL